ncbi:hypothetical protein IAQ61_001677 [Plenodomus lingam]|uniref:uncharacterized protein n=1 Tax=Leptosphaeria maculans TaxID=5022 RepID=UPI00332B2E08|nr:hypothetical protein IAQ61_001677 [Plenodomus lingam]
MRYILNIAKGLRLNVEFDVAVAVAVAVAINPEIYCTPEAPSQGSPESELLELPRRCELPSRPPTGPGHQLSSKYSF